MPDDGAPGTAHQIDLLLLEADAQIVNNLKGVADHLVHRQGRGRFQGLVGLAGASLVPGRDHESLLEVVAGVAHATDAGASRPAFEEQQDWGLG